MRNIKSVSKVHPSVEARDNRHYDCPPPALKIIVDEFLAIDKDRLAPIPLYWTFRLMRFDGIASCMSWDIWQGKASRPSVVRCVIALSGYALVHYWHRPIDLL
jgi:hypothetical protein